MESDIGLVVLIGTVLFGGGAAAILGRAWLRPQPKKAKPSDTAPHREAVVRAEAREADAAVAEITEKLAEVEVIDEKPDVARTRDAGNRLRES